MERAIEKINRRKWDILSSRWRDYLPESMADLPSGYSSPLNDEIVTERMVLISDEDRFESIGEIPRTRTVIFISARFCTERALYLTRNAEKLVRAGSPTVALTAAYLAMFFASRAVQLLLGICYGSRGESSWVLDVWSGASEITSQGQPKLWSPDIFGLITKLRIGHEHHWKIFIRLRAVSTRLPLESDAQSVLRTFKDHSDFSERRNRLQYRDSWPYADLYGPFLDEAAGVIPQKFKLLDNDRGLDLKVAQIISYCSAAMLLDVLLPLPKFKSYCSGIIERLGPNWHPLLNTGALAPAVERLVKKVA